MMEPSVKETLVVARKKSRKKIKKRRVSHKIRIKRAVKAAAKTLWKHLVELPEKEREQNLATIQRMVRKKLKWKNPQKRNAKLANKKTKQKTENKPNR